MALCMATVTSAYEYDSGEGEPMAYFDAQATCGPHGLGAGPFVLIAVFTLGSFLWTCLGSRWHANAKIRKFQKAQKKLQLKMKKNEEKLAQKNGMNQDLQYNQQINQGLDRSPGY